MKAKPQGKIVEIIDGKVCGYAWDPSNSTSPFLTLKIGGVLCGVGMSTRPNVYDAEGAPPCSAFVINVELTQDLSVGDCISVYWNNGYCVDELVVDEALIASGRLLYKRMPPEIPANWDVISSMLELLNTKVNQLDDQLKEQLASIDSSFSKKSEELKSVIRGECDNFYNIINRRFEYLAYESSISDEYITNKSYSLDHGIFTTQKSRNIPLVDLKNGWNTLEISKGGNYIWMKKVGNLNLGPLPPVSGIKISIEGYGHKILDPYSNIQIYFNDDLAECNFVEGETGWRLDIFVGATDKYYISPELSIITSNLLPVRGDLRELSLCVKSIKIDLSL